jgi:hypothetical protein
MNEEYYGYKVGDASSPFGNYIRVTGDSTVWCGMGCHDGGPDCRVSGSIFNSAQMIDPTHENAVGGWFGYQNGQGMSGFYVNSTLIRTKLGKCSYTWDGNTMSKVNNACGCPQGPTGPAACDEKAHPDASYFNRCNPPEYSETCTGDDPQVNKCWCENYHGGKPQDGTGHQCYFKGVAWDSVQGKDSEDETNKMLDWRVTPTREGSGGQYGPAITIWNEMVLDGRRMEEAMAVDPAGTIVAAVYAGKDDWSKGMKRPAAQHMARQMQQRWHLSKPIPVIELLTTVDTQTGKKTPVWKYNPADQPHNMEIEV